MAWWVLPGKLAVEGKSWSWRFRSKKCFTRKWSPGEGRESSGWWGGPLRVNYRNAWAGEQELDRRLAAGAERGQVKDTRIFWPERHGRWRWHSWERKLWKSARWDQEETESNLRQNCWQMEGSVSNPRSERAFLKVNPVEKQPCSWPFDVLFHVDKTHCYYSIMIPYLPASLQEECK